MSSSAAERAPVALRILGAAVAAGLAAVSAPALAEDLGLIRVESTTIDDRFEAKREEPSNISVISGEEVDTSHTENIQQLLQSVPGITTELQSGDSLKIHIRGVENQRYMGEKPGVAVVIDGVPVFERTGRVNIDLDNIESIKVVKGGASYLFGDDALSGAVIITTKRGAAQAGTRFAAEAGSFGYHKVVLRQGFANENMSAHVQASRRETDGYYEDSSSKADYLNGKFQYYLDDVSDLTFGFERSDRFKDSHGTVDGATAARLDPKSEWTENDDYSRMYNVDLAKYYVTYSRDFGATGNLLVNAYQFTDDTDFYTVPLNGYYNLDGSVITDPDAYGTHIDYHQQQRGVKSEYRSAGEQLAWMAGLDLRANTYESQDAYATSYKRSPYSRTGYVAGTPIQDDKTDEQVQAVYGELKYRVTAPLTLTLNGRYDHIDLDYSDYLNDQDMSREFDVTSWRLGGNYAFNDTTDLYANASTGFRAPSVEQLFAGDMNPDSNTDNNPNLKPETAVNLEIGLRRTLPAFGVNWDLDMALFQIKRDDYIMSSAGQYGSVSPEGEPERFENVGGMRSRGLELTLRSDPARDVWLSLSYTYLRSIFTSYRNYNLLLGNRYAYGADAYFNPATGGNADGVCDPSEYDPSSQYCLESHDLTGNDIPRTPAHHLNVGLNWRPAPRWTLTGEMDAVSSYYADELNWVEVGGHTVFNLLAAYDYRAGGNEVWSFFFRVDNLFDRTYWNTARGNYDGSSPATGGEPDGIFNAEDISIVVNQGRTFTFGVNATF